MNHHSRIPTQAALVAAAIAHLEIHAVNTDVLVGDTRAPDGAGWQGAPGQSVYIPHVTVYDLDGGTYDGPASAPEEDVESPLQFTCVGATAAQARMVADLVRRAFLTVELEVPDRHVCRVQPTGSGGVLPDTDVEPNVFYTVVRFTITTTPA